MDKHTPCPRSTTREAKNREGTKGETEDPVGYASLQGKGGGTNTKYSVIEKSTTGVIPTITTVQTKTSVCIQDAQMKQGRLHVPKDRSTSVRTEYE